MFSPQSHSQASLYLQKTVKCFASIHVCAYQKYCVPQELEASEVEDAELQEAIARSLRQDQPGADPHTLTCQHSDKVQSALHPGVALAYCWSHIALCKPPDMLLLLLLLWHVMMIDLTARIGRF